MKSGRMWGQWVVAVETLETAIVNLQGKGHAHTEVSVRTVVGLALCLGSCETSNATHKLPGLSRLTSPA